MSECMTQEDAMNMSDEQAVQILKPLRDMMIDQNGCPISDAVFALDKAIVALSKNLPSAQSERRKGEWIVDNVETEHCSVCKHRFYISALFAVGGNDEPPSCPWCGADMT